MHSTPNKDATAKVEGAKMSVVAYISQGVSVTFLFLPEMMILSVHRDDPTAEKARAGVPSAGGYIISLTSCSNALFAARQCIMVCVKLQPSWCGMGRFGISLYDYCAFHFLKKYLDTSLNLEVIMVD